MAFLSCDEIKQLGLKKVGSDVKISDKAVFYQPEKIEIGNHVRIDDFCVLSNHIILHDHVHIAVYSALLSGPNSVIELHDFCGAAFRTMLFTVTDDYSGLGMTNPTIPDRYRKITEASIVMQKHALLGADSMVFPGVTIAEGTAVGAMSMVLKTTKPWKIYWGIPARVIGERSPRLLELEKEFRNEYPQH